MLVGADFAAVDAVRLIGDGSISLESEGECPGSYRLLDELSARPAGECDRCGEGGGILLRSDTLPTEIGSIIVDDEEEEEARFTRGGAERLTTGGER